MLPGVSWQEMDAEPGLPVCLVSCCCVEQGLRAALQELCLQEGWGCQRLPTAQQLREVDRGDLLRVRVKGALAGSDGVLSLLLCCPHQLQTTAGCQWAPTDCLACSVLLPGAEKLRLSQSEF